MKRAILATPFAIMTGLAVVSHWLTSPRAQTVVGDTWAILFLWCLGSVPVISRAKLWFGYAAMIYPLLVLGLYVALGWGNLDIGW